MTKRDPQSGKFVDARGRHRRKRTRSGRSGPSRLSRLRLPELAEMLVGLEDEFYSLTINLGRFPDGITPLRPPAKVGGMLKQNQERQERRVAVLVELLDNLLVERCSAEFSFTELAELMSAKLGSKISARQLYREPYRSIINGEEDEGTEVTVAYNGRVNRVRRHARVPREVLIRCVIEIERKIAKLTTERNSRLINAAPDLEPIARPAGRERRRFG